MFLVLLPVSIAPADILDIRAAAAVSVAVTLASGKNTLLIVVPPTPDSSISALAIGL